MIISSIRGMIAHQVGFADEPRSADVTDSVLRKTLPMLDELAWFQRYPVRLLAALTTVACWVRHGTTLDKLDPVRRGKFLQTAGRLPGFDLLIKLLGSIALLHYFDAVREQTEA